MSEDPTHGATKIHASKDGGGGGAGKWLLGAVGAALILGGGYYAWTHQNTTQASNDPYASEQYASDDLRASPVEPNAQTASADDVSPNAMTASTEERTPAPRARRAVARTDDVPEEVVGIMPINATTDSDELVVTGHQRPIWSNTPSARRLSAMYPERALRLGREGEARLQCTVQDGGALDCIRTEETSTAFGSAAMRVAHTYRHAPTLADGSDATGSPVNLRVVFRIADDTRRG